jgi:hypothetical protein
MNLKTESFDAVILKDKDLNNQGRYKVQIPALMNLILNTDGIMVKNQIHKWRSTGSDNGYYGEYKPLHPGTKVLVKFHDNDVNTGYIDRIISDQNMNTLPFKSITDRDDVYQLLRTPRYNNLIIINETTENEPPNSVHLYFNQYRTTIILDEQGIHIYTDDNKDETVTKSENQLVKQNRNRTVDQNESILIKGNNQLQVNGSYDIKITAKCNIETSSDCNIKAGGSCFVGGKIIHIKASKTVNIDGPSVSINCGSAVAPGGASGNNGATIPVYRNSKAKSDASNTSRLVVE